MNLVPRWILWCVYGFKVILMHPRNWRCRVPFGHSIEFRSLAIDVPEHYDPWSRTTHSPCALYPITMVWFRVRLFPPEIEGPIWDCFNSGICQATNMLDSDKPKPMSPHMPAGERFYVTGGGRG